MGCLHDGHLSLVRQARQRVSPRGKVVVSIFVNPIQFGSNEDLSTYPRDLPQDKKLCREAGVDALFVPSSRELYPSVSGRQFSTCVVEETLSKGMEGVSRPTHFRGVATIVKDYQQAAIVKRMVRDLNFPVSIAVAPTRREPDGLAMSSRNKYLSPGEREQARALWQAIQQARITVRTAANGVPANRLKSELKWLIETRPAARVDYIEFFDADTLQPVATVKRGAHLALAVLVGKTRLIDNGRV